MKVMKFAQFGFDLMAGYGTPYYMIGFHSDPSPYIDKRKLHLKGDILSVSDCIACITGNKNSAGFEMLYPFAPIRFSYQGVYRTMEGDAYVLWLPEKDGSIMSPLSLEEFQSVYYAHALIESDKSLLFTLPGGAGRVIETDKVYRTHGEIPMIIRIENGSKEVNSDG